MKKITDETVNQVYKTTDYDRFSLIEGNRKSNSLHIRRLKYSMIRHQLMSIIIVNEKFQIIDGQHRFQACKEANLPIYYMICEGYKLQEVKILNLNSSNWNKTTFLRSYSSLGFSEYQKFEEFMRKFPKFNFMSCERLLTLTTNKLETVDEQRITSHSFEEGNFFIPDLQKSTDFANKIMMLEPYYAGFNRLIFVTHGD